MKLISEIKNENAFEDLLFETSGATGSFTTQEINISFSDLERK
jgi:hypothetical protein